MPQASMLVMSSPLLLGQVPVAGLVEVSASIPPIALEAPARPSEELLAISWTLTPSQEEPPAGQRQESDLPEDPEGDNDSEIIVEGEYGPVEGDPMGAVNETSFRITQSVDEAFVAPLAYGYRDGLPDPLRDGVGNFLQNLREPSNFLNFLLQFDDLLDLK